MCSSEALQEEFKFYGFYSIGQPVLESVVNFINLHNASIESVVSELVAFAGNRHEDATLTEQMIKEFKSGYFQKKKTAGRVHMEPTPPRYDLALKSDQDYNIMAAYGGSPVTPLPSAKRSQTTPDNSSSKRRSNVNTPVSNVSPLVGDTTPIRRRSCVTPSSKKYTKRANKSQVMMKYGDVDSVTDWAGQGADVDVSIARRDNSKFRYMFQKLQDKSHVLDRRVETLTESILQLYTAEIEECTDISEKTSSDVYLCGQICCDCDGRLNTESVVLQGCMSVSNGRSLPLSVSELPSYSLFPGQTVVVKAQNEDGRRLKAVKCYAPEPQPTTQIVDFKGLSLMVACGPFTPDNTNDYAPLSDLMLEVEKSPPDVLILMGPFINEENQVLQHSLESYEMLFDSVINEIFSKVIPINSSIQLIVVSSDRDLHHEPVYPTPPYHLNLQHPRVHLVANPSTVDINGVKVGLTSTDVLFQMAANEISWDASTKDRMLRLSEHLLCQRNYFPVYPPSTDTNLDLELNEEFGGMSTSPHLLVMSSNFNQFIKSGNKTVCCNPGRLCKGEGGGTYLRMVIDSIANCDSVIDSVKAQVIRI